MLTCFCVQGRVVPYLYIRTKQSKQTPLYVEELGDRQFNSGGMYQVYQCGCQYDKLTKDGG